MPQAKELEKPKAVTMTTTMTTMMKGHGGPKGQVTHAQEEPKAAEMMITALSSGPVGPKDLVTHA
eukprot:11428192-Karenia_brevis.AAC.1